jgi:hypothetical protein
MQAINSLTELIPDQNYLPTSHRMPVLEWIDKVGIMLRNRTYSTRKHEYLIQILADTHPNQTFEKAAQVAISTSILIKTLYVSEHLGKKCVYYFQDDSAVRDFSHDRAEPMIQESRYLTSRLRHTVNVGLKQVGPGSIYFRGLFTKGKAKSVDADCIVLDELDEAKEENVKFAVDRLMHSDLQWLFSLSQPSFPGFGIDKAFAETDQHYWHLVCPSCHEYNCLELNFPDNFLPVPSNRKKSFLDGATHYRGCKKCGARLNMAEGVWIAKQPSRIRRGYHLSQLYTQICPPDQPNLGTKFMREWESERKSQFGLARFTISVLGFPFSGGAARVTDELLDFAEGEHGFSFNGYDCFMGVDQGDTLTISIGGMQKGQLVFLYFEETEDWDRLDSLMQAFRIRFCVIDAQPNKHPAKALAARYSNRVAIQYFGAQELKVGKELHEGKIEVDKINVDRTTSIDAFLDKLEQGQIVLPSRQACSGKQLASLEDVRRHLKQLICRNETLPSGLMKKVYLSGNGIENHYGMSMNSATIAAFELGIRPSGPMVMPVFRQMGHA